MKSEPEKFFTVFTPTYNRAHSLHRVCKSLCQQQFSDFEWLIIDDGSSDNTSELVKGWQSEGRFPIRYVFQENQGKHVAWNKAALLARGKFFLCADSDDEFVPHALQRFKECLDSIPPEKAHEFFGAACLCQKLSGEIVGERFPDGLLDTNFIDLYFQYNAKGEKWYCGKTEIYRKYKFSEEFSGSYLPEGTLWFRLARKYKVRLIDEPLRIYHKESHSIMNSRTYPRNAPGMRQLSMMFLNEFVEEGRTQPSTLLLHATTYGRSSLHLGISLMNQLRGLTNFRSRMWWLAMFPKAYLGFFYDNNHENPYFCKIRNMFFGASRAEEK